MTTARTVKAGLEALLTPQDALLLLIDHQPQMAFAVGSHDRQTMLNNVVALAKSAKAYGVPTILTTIGAKGFAGPLFPEVQAVFSEQQPIDRTTMNAWEDQNVTSAVRRTGRKKLVMAGLWTEVCLAFPAIAALGEGFDVYFVPDASGGRTLESHNLAVDRMIQAGAIPLDWLTFLCELQRDHARKETAGRMYQIAREHSGAYAMGLHYHQALAGPHASKA
jgi:nicotinamidase-related amidase